VPRASSPGVVLYTTTRRGIAAAALLAFTAGLTITPVAAIAAPTAPAAVRVPDLVHADRARRPAVDVDPPTTMTLDARSVITPPPPPPAPVATTPPAAAAIAKPARHRPAVTAAAKTSSTRPVRKRTETATVPLPTGDLGAVLAFARSAIGKPYVFGAAGPNAFDCSGLVMAAYARIGIRLPHKASGMFGVGRAVSAGDIRPGDVLVLNGGGHTAIAIGGGLMIHASRAGRPVAIAKIYAHPNAVRRLVG
jgi:cell wall-associated NlpC family hydrolase